MFQKSCRVARSRWRLWRSSSRTATSHLRIFPSSGSSRHLRWKARTAQEHVTNRLERMLTSARVARVCGEQILWLKISVGLPPATGQSLNCHAGPCTNTATTRSHSSADSLVTVSITRYGTVESPFCRCSSTSLSRRAPPWRFSSDETNLIRVHSI